MSLDPEVRLAIRLMGTTAHDPPRPWRVFLIHLEDETECVVTVEARDAWTAHEEAARLWPHYRVDCVMEPKHAALVSE